MKNGPSNAKVIMTPNGPVLLELSLRCHGDDGAWIPLLRASTGGYTQVDATYTFKLWWWPSGSQSSHGIIA